MKTKNIIKGLRTLMPYYDDPDGYHNNGEHDMLYSFPTDKKLSDEDLDKMISLGWHQQHDDRDYGEDFSAKDYRQDESWVCYT